MFTKLWNLSVRTHRLLKRYAPTSRLITWLQTREGLRWGVPCMFLGVAYYYAVRACISIIDAGGPKALYLLVLLFGYNCAKFILFGPYSLYVLARVRLYERLLRKRHEREARAAARRAAAERAAAERAAIQEGGDESAATHHVPEPAREPDLTDVTAR